jgi:hypothetical protein
MDEIDQVSRPNRIELHLFHADQHVDPKTRVVVAPVCHPDLLP